MLISLSDDKKLKLQVCVSEDSVSVRDIRVKQKFLYLLHALPTLGCGGIQCICVGAHLNSRRDTWGVLAILNAGCIITIWYDR